MTIEEKWLSLFTHDLTSPNRINKDTAKQALILINWMAGKYEKYQHEQGYVVPEELQGEKKRVCEALESVEEGSDYRGNWPIDIFNKWAGWKPFHESLGSRYLRSDWSSFWELAQNKNNEPHGEKL